MTYNPLTISRRGLIAAGFAAAILPSVVMAQQGGDPATLEPTDMNIRMTFGGQALTGVLYDNASARDLFSMLPLDLTIDNYANNERIAYLPRQLTQQGSGAFDNEQPGDICYYVPWGNLALFHAGYSYSNGLIRLGRLDDFHPLLTRGKFPLRVEAAQ